ncbi:MAG: ATP-binding protein [Phyllobacteriaceae bacterium]|nr:ATP-binding protein [Phyllobacteriaceae bacterium]
MNAESQSLYKKIVENVRDPIFILDAQRQIMFANNAARLQFGLQLEGQSFVRIIRNPACLEAIDEVLYGAESRSLQITVENQYRTVYDVTIVSLDGGDGGKQVMVGLSDISHIHEAEQMRSDFVANVSHELRSPLTSLNGFIETLQGPAKGDLEASERFLALMAGEAQRMVRLISDLLSLSKVEANQRIRPEGVVNLVPVLQRLLKMLAGLAEKERKTVELEVPDEPVKVLGSEDELTQVFQNLVENAMKYGRPDSTVRLKVELSDNEPGIRGKAVSVTVIDQGEGIAREHIPRLTERFYRVDTHRSRDKGGTGLGLAIVKHIVGRHRGRLRIDSEPGVGSRFRVVLPATDASR